MRVVIARSLRLCIRPPGADHLESLEIMADKTVKELKHVIKTTVLQEQIEPGDKIRLVSSGRMLVDDETLQTSGVNDNAVIDCSITKFAVLRGLATDTPPAESNASNDLRGFDRLQYNGFSEEEVANIRAHFSSEVTRVMQRLPALADDSEQRFRAEEEWLRRHARDVGVETVNVPVVITTERMSSSPTLRRVLNLIVGFALGSFFGFLMIFLIADPNRPLSRSFKIGLIFGVLINTALQFWDPTAAGDSLSTEMMMPPSVSQEHFILDGQVITGTKFLRGQVSDVKIVVPVVGAIED